MADHHDPIDPAAPLDPAAHTAPTASPQPNAAEPRFVAGAISCPRCGYSVRGLPETGLCPECGTPVAAALQGNLLLYADPDYITGLHRGAILVMIGGIASLASFLIILALKAAAGLRWIPPPAASIVEGLEPIIAAAASGLGLVGWWLLSAPDPGWRGVDESVSARKIVRLAVAIESVTTLTVLCLHAAERLGLGGAAAARIIGPTRVSLELFGSIAWLLCFFASMQFLRLLARRMRDKPLADSAANFLWLGPLLYVGLFICMGAGPIIAAILYITILNQARAGLARVRLHAHALADAPAPLTTAPAGPPAAEPPTPPAP